MDGKVFNSRQSRHFSCIINRIQVLFPNCTWTWRVNNYVSHLGKSINNKNESTL